MQALVGVIFQTGHSQSLVMIGSNQRCRAIEREITRLRIDQHWDAMVGQRQNPAQSSFGNHTFLVVGNDESISARNYILEHSDDPILGSRIDSRSPLAVSANDELIVRDDSGLGSRRPAFIKHQVFDRLHWCTIDHATAQSLTCQIVSDDADDASLSSESHKIREHVCRAAEVNGLAPYINHRNGGLGRDTRNVTPDKLVKHYITEHDDLPMVDLLQDLNRTFFG
jgi:hypothetical protein